MSVGYQSPGPAFSGPDAGECRRGAPSAIARAEKVRVGRDEDGREVFRLTADLRWEDVVWSDRLGGSIEAARQLEAGSLVTEDGYTPPVWVEYATSAEHGRLAVTFDEANSRPVILGGEATSLRRIKAAFAARAALERGIPAYKTAEEWFDTLCRVAAGETSGMPGGKHSDREAARAALEQSETKAEEKPAPINNPFAALAALKGSFA